MVNVCSEDGVFVDNTLTHSREKIVTDRPNLIRWYSCGPTVYDKAHFGHAMNYMTIDIMRRILESYFGYEVQFVMNITDVDDKIIIRTKEKFFFDKYVLEADLLDGERLLEDLQNFFDVYKNDNLPREYLEKPLDFLDIESVLEKVGGKYPEYVVKFKTMISSLNAIKEIKRIIETNADDGKSCVKDRMKDLFDIIAYYHVKVKGDSAEFTNEMFKEFALYWERDFMKDMERLGVKPPNVKARVSEYMPEIVKYIQKISENGYAYETHSSVYFDTREFVRRGHTYTKLCTNTDDIEKLLLEGEGALTENKEKRCPTDFALWKKSKPGEPSWDSPWGKGRPGWHIECSAISGSIMPGILDIHSGGIDLAFPHHNNEIAQCEAFSESNKWCNYFLHVGHLNVRGSKMSKSLKNFVSISEILEVYTPRQLRLLFLTHRWNQPMDFKEGSLKDVVAVEKQLVDFFDNVRSAIALSSEDSIYGQAEGCLFERFHLSRSNVRKFLSNSFDTPSVMRELREVASAADKYISSNGEKCLYAPLLKDIGLFVTEILGVFGVTGEEIAIGFGGGDKGVSIEDERKIFSCVKIASSYRDEIRREALDTLKCKEGKDLSLSDLPKRILNVSDRVRDSFAKEGIILEDRSNLPSKIKIKTQQE